MNFEQLKQIGLKRDSFNFNGETVHVREMSQDDAKTALKLAGQDENEAVAHALFVSWVDETGKPTMNAKPSGDEVKGLPHSFVQAFMVTLSKLNNVAEKKV